MTRAMGKSWKITSISADKYQKFLPPNSFTFDWLIVAHFSILAAIRRTNPPGNVFNFKLKSPSEIFYGNLSARLNW